MLLDSIPDSKKPGECLVFCFDEVAGNFLLA
jgi:hypothetical protein